MRMTRVSAEQSMNAHGISGLSTVGEVGIGVAEEEEEEGSDWSIIDSIYIVDVWVELLLRKIILLSLLMKRRGIKGRALRFVRASRSHRSI